MDEATLKEIIVLHRGYLDGVPGCKRADLRNASLKGLSAPNAKLHNALLSGADMTGAAFVRGDFSGSDMFGAVLRLAVRISAKPTCARETFGMPA